MLAMPSEDSVISEEHPRPCAPIVICTDLGHPYVLDTVVLVPSLINMTVPLDFPCRYLHPYPSTRPSNTFNEACQV